MHDTTVATTALLVLLARGSVGALFFWEHFLRDALPMYNNYTNNGAVGIFEKNTNCLAHGINLSCASVWHVDGPSQEHPGWQHYKQPITLISPRHAIGAWHARPEVGWHYVFQALDGTMVTNKVTGVRGTDNKDILVCLLKDEMPSSFTPAKILPPNYQYYIGTGILLPTLSLDQENKALVYEVSDMEWVYWKKPEEGVKILFQRPTSGTRNVLYEELIGGDSGRPSYYIIGSQAVLLCAWWHGGNGDAPNIANYTTDIQMAMNALSISNSAPQFLLTFFNLTTFPVLTLDP